MFSPVRVIRKKNLGKLLGKVRSSWKEEFEEPGNKEMHEAPALVWSRNLGIQSKIHAVLKENPQVTIISKGKKFTKKWMH